jgi:hypothetical protein
MACLDHVYQNLCMVKTKMMANHFSIIIFVPYFSFNLIEIVVSSYSVMVSMWSCSSSKKCIVIDLSNTSILRVSNPMQMLIGPTHI